MVYTDEKSNGSFENLQVCAEKIMLEFERKIFQDLHDHNALFVFAKGLSVDRILVNFVKSYSDAGNLVIVLNLDEPKYSFFGNLLTIEKVKNIYTSSSNIGERIDQYFQGGIHFVSTQIFVGDLLKQRVPVIKITGIILFQAHNVLESCQEAFALRLFRQKNRTGFIKAISDKPENFLYGYGHMERIMRTLFVKEVFLWPRFHKMIQEDLKNFPVSLIELHVDVSSNTNEAQMCVLHLMNNIIKEIKNKNSFIEIKEITVENCLTWSFYKLLDLQLDPIWHQISAKTKQLITDLKTLQFLIRTLFNDEIVTFYSVLNACKKLDYAKDSTWVLSESGQKLLSVAKNMLFNSANELHPERPNKWKTLTEILQAEIMPEIKQKFELRKAKILILCQNIYSCNQLREILLRGPDKYLLLEIMKQQVHFTKVADSFLSNDKTFLENSIKESLDLECSQKLSLETDDIDEVEQSSDDIEKRPPCSVHFLTISQDQSGLDNVFFTSIEPFTQMDNLDLSLIETEEPLIMIQTFNKYKSNHDIFLRKTLQEIQPNFVIMYHCNHMAIREIEMYKAHYSDNFLRLYLLVYSKSVEEQCYLTELRREKQAFEYLIEKKAKLLLPGNEIECFEEMPDEKVCSGTILVDTRDFRSELPVILHKRGFRIDPIMLTVGDYILTPEICIERKSVSDLIGSLKSGRLFQQCTQMFRFYTKPMLLIEFDQNKSFNLLRGRYSISSDMNSFVIQERLLLLTLHFPKLKLIWSPNPYASAQLFEEMKAGREEPDVERAMMVGSNKINENDKLLHYNQKLFDFLEKLPGISSKNIDTVIKKGTNLRTLLKMSVGDFVEKLLMNSSDAKMLFNSLHKAFESN